MEPKGVRLECHRYGIGPKLSRVNMEDALQAVSITKDITGKEDIQLSMLGSFEDPQTAFVPGDFAVLKDQAGNAWSWGRVSLVRSQLKRDIGGALTHAPYAVMVQGWYDFLTRSKLHVNSNSNRPTVGTMFNIKDWLEIEEGIKSMYGQPAGALLQFMVSKLMRIKLPESLGGGWLGDEIPVVYDADTARTYAPEFEDIEPVEFGPLAPSLTTGFINTRSSDIGAIIASMFLFENMLVELVPYLSVGGVLTQYTPQTQAPTNANSPLAQQPAANTTPVVRSQTGMTKLGRALGAQPVLVYRIKPFRANPLYTSAVSKIHYTPEEIEGGYLSKQLELYDDATAQELINARAQARNLTTKSLFDAGRFSQQTFQRASIVPLPYSHILNISRQRSDAERLNAATINAVPPTSAAIQVTDVDYLGLPITIDNQVEEHGLRLRIAKWDLYPPDNAVGNDVDIYYRAVAAQVMQFYQNAHLYESGSMTLHFTHTLYFVESDPRGQSTYDKGVLGMEPGRWFSTMFQGMDDKAPTPSDEYYGYITSVTHNLQRLTTGSLAGSTQLTFQRGHFAEMWDVLHGANVPLGDIDKPQGPQPLNRKPKVGPAGQPKNAATIAPVLCSTYLGQKALLDQFINGTASTRLWGVTPAESQPRAALDMSRSIANRAPSARPVWLQCWMLEATSVMNSAAAQSVETMLASSSTDPDYAASLWLLAASAYVIERYWRSRPGYDAARVRIRSVKRTNDGYHDIWSAMDFYIELPANFVGEVPGALQVWASLNRLAEAQRIPFGGRGLYLNVNPLTGIAGTTPQKAGYSSKPGLNYPPGGSSWTHYDLRGSFGITRIKDQGLRINAAATKWVGTDWNGDGSDELTTGAAFPPANVKPGDKDYIENGGITDTQEQVMANISDPGFAKLNKYLKADIAQRCPGVSAIVQQRKAADPTGAIELSRLPVREEINSYFNRDGEKDTWLHPVTPYVPNLYQVFDLAQLTAAQVAVPAAMLAAITPDKSGPEGDLYLAKDANNNYIGAPLVMVFGGVNVNGKQAREYMKPYMELLLTDNHVFIATNDKVDFNDCYSFATGGHNPRPPEKRVLYAFSNGIIPVSDYIQATAGAAYHNFDKIYLVDAFLQGAHTAQVINDMKVRPSTYSFIYTPAYSTVGNGMSAATLSTIQGIPGLERHKHDVGSSELAKHMAANERAVELILASGLVK